MTNSEIIKELKTIVGQKGVLTSKSKTAYYRSGFRSGFGGALGVVFPKSLLELWNALKICVDANCVIIMQATKTGLTEGSSPSGFDYDREVIIINISRIKKIIMLDGGNQVIAFPGSTLHELEGKLAGIDRAPHSVIGSTTIGATIVGGIANNAGGALCKRGSSYTELALYARVNEEGNLELINHLGINNLGETPEEIFENLEKGSFDKEDIEGMDRAASDRDYQNRIRDINANTPNRYNADPKRLFEVSGSAGKVVAFAVRVDTYPMPKEKKVFYIGTNNPEDFSKLRKHILQNFSDLPEMCEYMNREIFDTAKKYGKDVFLSIKHIGTKRLPKLYAIKSNLEYFLNKIPLIPKFLPDQFLYYVSQIFPEHLPKRLIDYRNKYEHYLILHMSDEGIKEARDYLQQEWKDQKDFGFFECNEKEQQAALTHRFAAAGAAIRYQTMHQSKTEEVLALDIALLGNDKEWLENIPDDIKENLELSLYYGHFMCHVFHHDYILKKGSDIKAIKEKLLKRLDKKSAKYPAEHNVGHMYEADENLRNHYRELDPTNTFNPGIGFTDKKSNKNNYN